MTTRTVVAAGPDADFDSFLCEEIPVWTVAIEDDNGEPIGKAWTTRSRTRAQELMRNIARDRRLPMLDETAAA